jgi:delta24-sterol reductase
MKERHADLVREISSRIKTWKAGDKKKKLRIAHGGTNSTRQRNLSEWEFIDVSGLNQILEVNIAEKWISVEPNVSMRALAEETLKFSLLPEVVPEFPEITVGGAIQGAALESSSFKYGQFNDSCFEYELVTGEGEIVKASRDSNADIYYGLSGSYGTLAVITLAKIRLVNASDFVKVTYSPARSFKDALDVLKGTLAEPGNDFAEGIVFSSDVSVVISGVFVNEIPGEPQRFSRAGDPWFYRNAQKYMRSGAKCVEYIPIRDYIFRYDRGAFWMGSYVFSLSHIPDKKFTRFLLNPFLMTKKLYDGLHAVQISQNYFIQDFYLPFDQAQKYLELADQKLGVYPMWLCPIKSVGSPQKLSPHYREKEDMLVNIGIYGQSKKTIGGDLIILNREMERAASEADSRKMLYAHAYYPKEEFWKIYDHDWYRDLRKKYDNGEAFPEIWEKVFVSKRYKPRILRGLLKANFESLRNIFGLRKG